MSTRDSEKRIVRGLLLAAVLSFSIASAAGARAAPPGGDRRSYNLPAGDASLTLKAFAQQSGRELVYPANEVKGVRTETVRGEYTDIEALHRMLAGTELIVVQDEKTGAIAVNRTADPNGRGAAQMASDRPGVQKSDDGTVVMSRMEVTGSRLPQTEIEGVSPVVSFDREFLLNTGFATTEEFLRTLPQNFTGAAAGRPGVPNDENPVLFTRNAGQSGVGLRGLGSNSTLVLINGRRAPLSGRGNNGTTPPQGFFDINTIPIGMIERIEVLTDGASAIYGTDAIGGVVNIILKKEYRDTELRTRIGGTWHGGGFERGATLTHGFAQGRLHGTAVVDWFTREALMASQRPFSKNQDHTSRGGSDLRSSIGYPVTIFALPNQVLNGLFNPDGTPATQAVAPSGQDGTHLTVADFAASAGQRTYYDSAELYSLVTPTERYGVSLNAEYELTEDLQVFTELSYTYNKTDSLANPVISSNPSGSATLRIPVNNPFNPFHQTLGFSVAHVALGPRRLLAETDSYRALAGVRLTLPHGWSAEASFMLYSQDLYTENPLANNATVNAALAETDPSKALNLFGDFYGSGSSGNKPGVYESIITNTTENSDSDLYTGELLLRGPVWQLPAGPVQVAAGGEWDQQDRVRTTNTPSVVLPQRSREVRNSYAAYSELSIPLVGWERNWPMLRSLDLQLAGRYENIEDAGETFDPKYGVRWKPFKDLLLRASYGTGYRAPAPTELERPESDATRSFIDRKRNETYPMLYTTGSFPNLEPETSKTYNAGAILNVPGVRGLSLGVDFYRKEQENLTTSLAGQQIIDFEDIFPERVIREPASPADVAAGKPGRITELDGRFINFGLVVTQGYDFNLNYLFNTRELGRFSVRGTATYLEHYKVAFTPGSPLEERKGDFGFPQDFKGNLYFSWNRGNLGGSVICYYQSDFERNGDPVESWTTWDASGSYLWKKHNVRFQGTIGNIFDKEPPFVDTLWGYDGGFHNPRMRTYSASVTYTF